MYKVILYLLIYLVHKFNNLILICGILNFYILYTLGLHGAAYNMLLAPSSIMQKKSGLIS